ncbi:hypothetical protein AgCh_032703 [Apium graveolens]
MVVFLVLCRCDLELVARFVVRPYNGQVRPMCALDPVVRAMMCALLGLKRNQLVARIPSPARELGVQVEEVELVDFFWDNLNSSDEFNKDGDLRTPIAPPMTSLRMAKALFVSSGSEGNVLDSSQCPEKVDNWETHWDRQGVALDASQCFDELGNWESIGTTVPL